MDDASRSHLLDQVLAAATRTAVVAIDAKGCIELINPGAERLLGISAKETVGTALVQVPAEPASVRHVAVIDSPEHDPVWSGLAGELCFHHRDGSAQVLPVTVTERR